MVDGFYRNAAGPLVWEVQKVLHQMHDSLKRRFPDGALKQSPPRPSGRIDFNWDAYLRQVQTGQGFKETGAFVLSEYELAGDVFDALHDVFAMTKPWGPTLLPLADKPGAADIRFAPADHLRFGMGASPQWAKTVLMVKPLQLHLGFQANNQRHAIHKLLSVDQPSIVLVITKGDRAEQADAWQHLMRNTEHDIKSRAYYFQPSEAISTIDLITFPLLAQYLDPYQLVLVMEELRI